MPDPEPVQTETFEMDPEADYTIARESNPNFDLTGSYALTDAQKEAEVVDDVIPIGPDAEVEPTAEKA